MDIDLPSEHERDRLRHEGSDTPQVEREPREERRRGNRYHAFRRKQRARRGERARANDRPDAPPTSAQMRHARASGRTPGISTAMEPASVPLGIDDEAAGMPAGVAELRREIERADRAEGMLGLGAADAMRGRPGYPAGSPRTLGKLVALVTAAAILGLLAKLLF